MRPIDASKCVCARAPLGVLTALPQTFVAGFGDKEYGRGVERVYTEEKGMEGEVKEEGKGMKIRGQCESLA